MDAQISPETYQAIKDAFPNATDQEINTLYPQIRQKLESAGFGHVPDSEAIKLTAHIFERANSQDPEVMKQNDLARASYLTTMSKTGDAGQAALNTFQTMGKVPGFQSVQTQFGPEINKIHGQFQTDPNVQAASGAAQTAAINEAPQTAQAASGPTGPANVGQPVQAQLKDAPANTQVDIGALVKQMSEPIGKAYGDYKEGVKGMETGRAISSLGAAIAGVYNPERIAQNDSYWQNARAELLKTTVGAAKDQMEATLKAITAAGQIQDLTQKSALFPEQYKNAQLTTMKSQLEVQSLGYDMAQKMRDEAFRQKMDDPASPETAAIKKSMDKIRKEAGIPDSVYQQWNGTAASAFLHTYEPINKMQLDQKKAAVEEMNAVTNRQHIDLGYAQIKAQDRATAATNKLAGAQLGATLQEKAAGDIDKHQTEVTATTGRLDALQKAQKEADESLGLLTGWKHENGKPVTDGKTGARVVFTIDDGSGKQYAPGAIRTGPGFGSDTLWDLRKRAPGGAAVDYLDKLMSSNTLSTFSQTKGIRNQKEFEALSQTGISRKADDVANVNTLKRASDTIQKEIKAQNEQLKTTGGLLEDSRKRYGASADVGSKLGTMSTPTGPQAGPAAVGAGMAATTISPSAGAMGTSSTVAPKTQAEYNALPSGTVYMDTDGQMKRKK